MCFDAPRRGKQVLISTNERARVYRHGCPVHVCRTASAPPNCHQGARASGRIAPTSYEGTSVASWTIDVAHHRGLWFEDGAAPPDWSWIDSPDGWYPYSRFLNLSASTFPRWRDLVLRGSSCCQCCTDTREVLLERSDVTLTSSSLVGEGTTPCRHARELRRAPFHIPFETTRFVERGRD